MFTSEILFVIVTIPIITILVATPFVNKYNIIALTTATLRLLLTSMQSTSLSDLLYSQIHCTAEHQ
jgi:hypothetical protein